MEISSHLSIICQATSVCARALTSKGIRENNNNNNHNNTNYDEK